MKLWILVCNASQAFFYETVSTLNHLKQVHELTHPAARSKSIDLVSDKPGSKGNKAIHGGAPEKSSVKEIELQKFSQEISQALKSAYNDHRFEKLVLVAPPKLLGVLKQNLNGSVDKTIANTINKDVTYMNANELANMLSKNINTEALLIE